MVRRCCVNDNITVPASYLYDNLQKNLSNLKLPRQGWGVHNCVEGKVLIFSFVKILPFTANGRSIITAFTKQVAVNGESKVEMSFLGRNMDFECTKNNPTSASEFEELLSEIDKLETCLGGPGSHLFKNIHPECAYRDGATWRHNKCPVIMKIGSVCSHCISLHTSYNLSKTYLN